MFFAMQRLVRFSLLALVALLPASLAAQTRVSAADSAVYERARQLVANGNGAAGRVLVDSMMTVAPPDSPAYAEALYWRAALAATGADAEADYRRIVVEYPLSPRAGDALLQLAQLEMTRGDRAAAAAHFERFFLEYPKHPERAKASLAATRVLFDLNEAPRACIVLTRALRDIDPAQVELQNQLSYYAPRCATVDTTAVVAAARSDSQPAASGKAAPKREAASTSSKPAGRFTVQVCACATRAEADALVKRLKAGGFDARVVGTAKPFRVRVGRYDTRAAATTAAGKIRAKKFDAFVTEIGGVER